MKRYIQVLISTFVFVVSLASLSLAATVTVVPAGGGSFSVMGGAMDGVAGIELNITYDAASLGSPNVVQGALVSGSIFMANANIPGSIKVAIISTTPFKGSGQIAAITFGSQTGSGTVSGISASLINISGGAVAVQAAVAPAGTITPPAESGGGTSVTQPAANVPATSTPNTTSAAAGGGISSALGTISMAADSAPAAATAPASQPQSDSAPTAASTAAETTAAVAEPPAAAEPVAVQAVYGGVVERFRAYQGERTPAAMTGLFKKPISTIVNQQPAIVVSDGTATVRLIADLPAGSSSAPNFALNGAKKVSLKSGEVPGRWVLEALPNKGTSKASVTILQGGSVLDYQLTVVPPIAAISGKEADFAAFLKDRDAKPTKLDLNADGRHDYLDDYIYTAHYLLLQAAPKK
jgi:hypothetical protein